ncbi:hypothetical protein, partial [Klebsiella pneumoniae]|uniref:hypothetical protein n=1 Tax=Klebsiella pneumoniae TaxID=573 RepID=UPI001E1512A8
AAPSAKGDDKFITTDYLQQCPKKPFGAQRLRRNRASGYVEPGDSRERGSRHGIHPNNAPNTRFSTSERK